MARKPRRKPLTLAQRRARPDLRSKLPMSQLTPAQQATRRKWKQVKTENANRLYDPTVKLGGHSLAQAARDLADIDVAPKFNALNRQLTSATAQGSALAARSGDYYRQLAHEELGKVAQQKALAGMLNQQTTAVGAQTQGAFDQMGAAEQQRQAADTTLRGAGLG